MKLPKDNSIIPIKINMCKEDFCNLKNLFNDILEDRDLSFRFEPELYTISAIIKQIEDINTYEEHPSTTRIRKVSGTITSEDNFVKFLYILLRDYVHPGDIETILRDFNYKEEAIFSNGWLAEYAKDIVDRLKENNTKEDI